MQDPNNPYAAYGGQVETPDQNQPQNQARSNDPYAKYQQVHTKAPEFYATPETRNAAAHTQPGTETTEQAAHPQADPFFTGLISPKKLINTVASFSPDFPLPSEIDAATPIKKLSDANAAAGKPRGIPGMITDSADMASSMSSPVNLGLTALGGFTAAAPELSVITKPIMAGAGGAFGISGANDVYHGVTDKDLEAPDRARKILLGGAQIAGAGEGLHETGVFGGKGMRGSFNRGMDVRAANEPFTPRELYDAAAQHGINLDLADATGNRGPAKAAKFVTKHSLVGSGPFEANAEHNLGALDQWGHDLLDNFSRYSGEASGSRIMEALKDDYEKRKSGASQEFEDLDKRVGPNTIDGTQTVEAEAGKIRDQMKDYYDKHPELVPKEAWKIINDLAERPTVTRTKTVTGTGFGQPQNKVRVQVPAKANNFSWSELHQLRSDLMDIYRNSPELIKSREQSWLQQMVKTIDDTMTGAAANLSPADRAQFRHANEEWEGIKSTYDNPQHPLYRAIPRPNYNPNASEIAGTLLNSKAPEFVRQLRGILGPAFGDLQRSAAESILGADRSGAGYDFKNMPGRMTKLKPGYMRDLFGPAGDDLRKISKIGAIVTRDINPSGTAKVLQPVGEIGAMASSVPLAFAGHPVPLAVEGGGMLAQRGISKAMNSPRITRFLTDREQARPLPPGLPIAGAAASDQNEVDRALDFMRQVQRERRGEISGQ